MLTDLELDVTESMLAHVTLHKNSVLDRLQQLGVNIAIDDFGTQYSSLDYLKTYRVSRVKIPRLMLDAAMRDPGESAMVRAIIGVARELNIDVIAQGVETEAQRDLLTCVPSTTKVQGYYYSAPVPAIHATELLRQRLIEPRLSQMSEATAAQ
jgi:EAL domain-containing protein (putative c-di-GMP-specific phosphodiesterase class I)